MHHLESLAFSLRKLRTQKRWIFSLRLALFPARRSSPLQRALLLCILLVIALPVRAQTLFIDIPPSTLSEAILELSEQTDTTVIAPAKALEGKRSPGLRGNYTKEQAIRLLLQDTQLNYSFTANGNVRVDAPPTNPLKLRRAHHKTPSRSRSANPLEEVVVSSGRRAQPMQKYAGTVNALHYGELDRLAIGYDFQSIQAGIPGLQISLNEGFQEIFVRGIGTQDNSVSSDQPTAMHYNNAYVPKLRGLGPVMFDIDRVEVHQGPQGTLRGRNATAGAINILPNAPDPTNAFSELRLESGSYSLHSKQVMVNFPILANTLALRFAYHSRNHADYYSNARRVNDAIEPPSGAGSEDENAWRASILWEPQEHLATYLVVDKASSGGSGFPGNYAGQTFSQGDRINDLENPWRQFFQTAGKVDTDILSAVLTQDVRISAVDAELIVSHREYESLTVNPRRPFQHGFVNHTVQTVDDISVWEFDNYNTNWISDASSADSVELRFASPQEEGALYWTAGIYVFDEASSEFRWDVSDASALEQLNLGGPDLTKASAFSRSIYADLTANIAPHWRGIAGLRFTHERKSSRRWDAHLVFEGLQDSLDLDADGDFTEIITTDNDLGPLVRLGTPGFAINPASEQALHDPNSFTSAYQFLQSMVSEFGERDTLNRLLATQPEAGRITTIAPNGIAESHFDDTYFNWRLGFEHDFSSTHMLYGTASNGTRAGGINPPIYVAGELVRDTFDNEELYALELGSKSHFQWREHPAKINLSAFYYQYKNQIFQIGVLGDSDIPHTSGSNINADLRQANVNIGGSQAYGLSLDTELNIAKSWLMGWNLLLLHTEITEGHATDGRQRPRQIDTNNDGNLEYVAPPMVDLEGNALINSPQLSSNIHVGQQFAASSHLVMDWTLSMSYKSRFHSTPFENKGYNFEGTRIPLEDMTLCCDTQFADANGDGKTELGDGRFYNDEVDSSLIVNLNLGVTFGNQGQHRIEAYGRNLTKEAYPQKQIVNAAVNIVFLNTPRMFGLRFSTRF